MTSFEKSDEPLFAAEAGVHYPVQPGADPYRALDDLMAAVEALCPLWPPRATFTEGGKMLL